MKETKIDGVTAMALYERLKKKKDAEDRAGKARAKAEQEQAEAAARESAQMKILADQQAAKQAERVVVTPAKSKRGRAPRVNVSALMEFFARYEAGESDKDLARAAGIHQTTFRRYRRKAGVPDHPHVLKPKKIREPKPRKVRRSNPKEMAVLAFIHQYATANHYPPSIREIGDMVGISSTSVTNYYVDKLARAGLVERNRKISRGTRLTAAGLARLGVGPDPMEITIACPHCEQTLTITIDDDGIARSVDHLEPAAEKPRRPMAMAA